MRDIKNIKIIAVDAGYGNIKTANTVTPTGITAYDTAPIFSGSILEYEGKYYRVGESHKEFIADKVEDDDFYLLTLMAIAKELNISGNREANVYLAAGLPMKWIRSQRDSFQKYLLQNEHVTFRFNGKDYKIHFVGCSVFPQGYPAIVNQLGAFNGINLLADIGNGTMNILYINDRKPVEDRCWTEKLGVNQCMIAAKNAIMDSFGVKIDDLIVEQVLRHGSADISKPYLDCIAAVAKRYVADIFATLRKYEYNPNLMRLYIVGGGGCLVKHFGDFAEGRVKILDDICATAKGYEYLAFTALRRKGGL